MYNSGLTQGLHREVFYDWVFFGFVFLSTTQSSEVKQNRVLLCFIADKLRLIDYRALLRAECRLANGGW